MLRVAIVDAARRILGASHLQPLFVKLSGLDESPPYTTSEVAITATNSDPSGVPSVGPDTIDLRRRDGSTDSYWTLKWRFTSGVATDTIEIIPWCYDGDARQWYPLAKVIAKYEDDIDEQYGGTITIQAVPGATHMYLETVAVSAGAELALFVRGSS